MSAKSALLSAEPKGRCLDRRLAITLLDAENKSVHHEHAGFDHPGRAAGAGWAMTAEGGVFVRTGAQVIPLVPQQIVAVGEHDAPSQAFAAIRCESCDEINVIGAPVIYRYHDDDHLGYLDVWYESCHVRGCTRCGLRLEVELDYAVRTAFVTGARELLLEGVRRASGGRLVPPEAIQIPEEELRRTQQAFLQTESRLFARSSPECQLYIELHPCECGERDLPSRARLTRGDDGLVARYRGVCPGCTAAREFSFSLDSDVPPVDAFGGGRQSRIICPGQFALHSDRLVARWPLNPRALRPEAKVHARADVFWAIRCLEEVLKFIPEGADAVPVGAFASPEGRAAFHADPGRFRRFRLQLRLAACREMLLSLDGGGRA